MAAQKALSYLNSFGRPNISPSSSFQQKCSIPSHLMVHQRTRPIPSLKINNPKKNINPSFASFDSYDCLHLQALEFPAPKTLETSRFPRNPNPSSFHVLPPSLTKLSLHDDFVDSPSKNQILPALPEDCGFIEPPGQVQDGYIGDVPPTDGAGDSLFGGFSSPEDQILLAPFLADVAQEETLDYPSIPAQAYLKEDVTEIVHVPLRKPIGIGDGGGEDEVSPQSIAARERRRKITERTAELGKIIPGANKMSSAEMFQAAYKYVKFLESQVSVLKRFKSFNKEMKEKEQLNVKEMKVLASPYVQEKLYSEEKCLIPEQILDETLAKSRKRGRSWP